MPAPAVINRLPLVSSLLKWFKGDELTIDNALFKLHHQVKRTESRFSWDWVKFKQGYSTNIYLILPLFSRPAPLLWCLGSCSFSWKIIWTVEPLSARAETIMQGEQVYSWDEERVDEGGVRWRGVPCQPARTWPSYQQCQSECYVSEWGPSDLSEALVGQLPLKLV